MDFKTFIMLFDKKVKEDKAAEFLEDHVVGDYVPYETKVAVAERIVSATYWRTIGEGDTAYSELHIDSTAKYMLTCMSIFDLYTDIERDKGEGKMLEEFNALNSRGIFDAIIRLINERDIKEFRMVLEMVADDVVANNYENHAFIRAQVERFGQLIGATLLPVLKEIDADKIQEVLAAATLKK